MVSSADSALEFDSNMNMNMHSTMNKTISTIFLVFSALTLCNYTEGFSPTTRSSVSKIDTSTKSSTLAVFDNISIIHQRRNKIAATANTATASSLNARPTPKDKFGKQINDKRRKQLGISDDEDEYDLGVALEQNTDPLITKIIAGSLILAITALLVAGIVVPSMTDYGEGVCNPILTGGRC